MMYLDSIQKQLLGFHGRAPNTYKPDLTTRQKASWLKLERMTCAVELPLTS